ncbi:MAG: hypothetical protein PHD36_01695 [Desulfotomaculaceae bacterium]|nr:hypothetical protein [Desulfotomaculaceae bacterium]
MAQKEDRCKVYEFTPRKSLRLKTVKYISPEKIRLLKQREQSKKDRTQFNIGVGVMLIIVAVLTIIVLK